MRFYACRKLDEGDLVQPWEQQIGNVEAFATAHHDHMILLVGDGGHFYIFTDPDNQLYAGPRDFGELMCRLLWGYRYGPTIPKDVERARS